MIGILIFYDTYYSQYENNLNIFSIGNNEKLNSMKFFTKDFH